MLEKPVYLHNLLDWDPGYFRFPLLFFVRLLSRERENLAHPEPLFRFSMGRLERPPVVVAQR